MESSSTIKTDVYNVLLVSVKARDDVNVCITKYMKSKGITHVKPSIWGRADSVRRAWRYWINTKQAFPSASRFERRRQELKVRKEYSSENRLGGYLYGLG